MQNIKNIILFLKDEFLNNRLAGYAAQLAYSLLFSIIPLLILLSILLRVIVGSDAQVISNMLSKMMPGFMKNILVFSHLHGNLEISSFAAFVYFLLLVHFGTMFIRTFNLITCRVMYIPETRNFVVTYLLAIRNLIVLAFILIIPLLILLSLNYLLSMAADAWGLTAWEYSFLFDFTDKMVYAIPLVVLIVAFMFATPERLSLKTVFPGSIFITIVWLIGGLLAKNPLLAFIDSENIALMLEGVVLLLVFVYLMSLIIVIGMSINYYYMRVHPETGRRYNHGSTKSD
ncbi:MAG: YihY/virulence factor BrkB family protein [Eubacteriaceae bacterium]|nr:YihY/virulence factor BrkB family protein [Eubacteriaceae bacterium]